MSDSYADLSSATTGGSCNSGKIKIKIIFFFYNSGQFIQKLKFIVSKNFE